MPGEQLTEEDREVRVEDLKELIEKGEYRVDPTAVADAILQRLRELADERTARVQPENECSYPDSLSGPSVNTAALAASTTEPILVRPVPFRRFVSGVLSSVAQVAAGKHAQIS
jgi:hypothetical protein